MSAGCQRASRRDELVFLFRALVLPWQIVVVNTLRRNDRPPTTDWYLRQLAGYRQMELDEYRNGWKTQRILGRGVRCALLVEEVLAAVEKCRGAIELDQRNARVNAASLRRRESAHVGLIPTRIVDNNDV